MERSELGRTGLKVSNLCFGTLTIGPLQRGLSEDEGGRLIRSALERGVNFVDTAELYGTYAHIREALRGWSQEVVIATKSYAYDKNGMWESVERARTEMDRDIIPLFLLHEQESRHTLRGHRAALDALLEAKARGLVQAVGLSTHYVAAVQAAMAYPEIEVISPLINVRGIGIQDGSRHDMESAIAAAASAGKGIYAMKPFGGGHLGHCWDDALSYLLGVPGVTSMAVGMKSFEELERNVSFFAGSRQWWPPLTTKPVLHIEEWCSGCGRCVDACPAHALALQGGRVVCDGVRCVFCGYCGSRCAELAIKVI